MLTEGVERIILGDERLNSMRSEDPAAAAELEIALRRMWRAFEEGRMDLSYAESGRVYGAGIPVYDYDDLTELLLEYGFRVQEAFQFIEEFSDSFSVSGVPRLVAVSERRARMLAEVEPLPENDQE